MIYSARCTSKWLPLYGNFKISIFTTQQRSKMPVARGLSSRSCIWSWSTESTCSSLKSWKSEKTVVLWNHLDAGRQYTRLIHTPSKSLTKLPCQLYMYSQVPIRLFSCLAQPHDHAFGGALTLSGTSGFTSITTLKRSSTTLSPLSPPSFLISSSFLSASLAASSSAFLLPRVCCRQGIAVSMTVRGGRNVLLELAGFASAVMVVVVDVF